MSKELTLEDRYNNLREEMCRWLHYAPKATEPVNFYAARMPVWEVGHYGMKAILLLDQAMKRGEPTMPANPAYPAPKAAAEWPRYRSHKIVQAVPIVAITYIGTPQARLYVQATQEGMLEQFSPTVGAIAEKAQVNDLAIRYTGDGYKSVSPRAVFDDGYTLIVVDPEAKHDSRFGKVTAKEWRVKSLVELLELHSSTRYLEGDAKAELLADFARVADDMIAPSVPAFDTLVKHMVDRFLWWVLPEPWHPDGGIEFKKTPLEVLSGGMPTGTNLFDATQAEAMIRHMLEGAGL